MTLIFVYTNLNLPRDHTFMPIAKTGLYIQLDLGLVIWSKVGLKLSKVGKIGQNVGPN